jgi:hypothetical protein
MLPAEEVDRPEWMNRLLPTARSGMIGRYVSTQSPIMLWFKSNKVIDEFATKLATDLSRRYPPELENDPSKKRNPERLTKAFDNTFNRALDFQREHKFGSLWEGAAWKHVPMAAQRASAIPRISSSSHPRALVNFVATQRAR